ncbi:MAG: hypothetical protein Kapaf2KO_23680 [Candidatus Kapaibacteriales bacterium]
MRMNIIKYIVLALVLFSPIISLSQSLPESYLDIYAINTKGIKEKLVKVQVEDFIRTRQFPLLNYIFFDENSTYLTKYKLFSSQTEREISNFDPNKRFLSSEVDEVYNSIIDIYGFRLTQHPEEKIELRGYVSEKEKKSGMPGISTAESRAKQIKKYLTGVWGIGEDRITITTDSDNLPEKLSSSKISPQFADEENQRVEIISDFKISQPLIVMDTTIRSNPPMVRFSYNIDKDEEAVSSYLYVRHGRELMFQKKKPGLLVGYSDWRISKKNSYSMRKYGSLLYNLEIIDSIKNKKRIQPAPKIEYVKTTIAEKIEKKINDKTFKRYNLILFDFNSSEMGSYNQKILEKIKEDIGSSIDYKLYVSGFTDTLGSEDYNLKISESRASNVKEELVKLGIEEERITVIANGETKLPYVHTEIPELRNVTAGDRYLDDENIDSRTFEEIFRIFAESPAGRFYSRTVVIEVEIN